jgi:hypothetical protein
MDRHIKNNFGLSLSFKLVELILDLFLKNYVRI